MVHPELLEILRCPACVSGPDRKPGPDPGQLELVRDGAWLACLEAGCGRKYPIREDIPVMLIDEGDRWTGVAVADLPEPGPLVPETEQHVVVPPTEPTPGLVRRIAKGIRRRVRGTEASSQGA